MKALNSQEIHNVGAGALPAAVVLLPFKVIGDTFGRDLWNNELSYSTVLEAAFKSAVTFASLTAGAHVYSRHGAQIESAIFG